MMMVRGTGTPFAMRFQWVKACCFAFHFRCHSLTAFESATRLMLKLATGLR